MSKITIACICEDDLPQRELARHMSGVQKGKCERCESVVFTSPSSREIIESGLGEIVCNRCVDAELGGKTPVFIRTQSGVEDERRWLCEEAERN